MADETTITTTTQGWPDDADGRWPDPVSSEKHYYFSDDSDVLYVHDWNVEHPRNYERFVRRPGLHDISGTYVFSRDTNDWEWQSSYEISADSFVYETVVYARESRSGAASEHFRLTGDLRLEDYYMFMSVTGVEYAVDGEPSSDSYSYIGQELRFAYAPTAEPDSIAISPFWNEMSYDESSKTWKDRQDNQYGNYWVFAKRQ